MAAKKSATTTTRITKASAKASEKAAKLPAAKKTKSSATTVKAVEAPKARSRFGAFSRMPVLNAAVAEFVGAFLLAAIVLATRNEPLWVMFGLIGVVLGVGAISGAHVNPAITIGAWVTKRITSLRALAYVLAQILGAMLALVVITSYVNAAPAVSEEAAMYGQTAAAVFSAAPVPEGKEWGVFFAELLGLTVFSFFFASAYSRRREIGNYALTIGLGFFVALTVAGAAAAYIGGAAILNPAAAVALDALSFEEIWTLAIYLLAPVLGGILGFALNDLLRSGASADDQTV